MPARSLPLQQLLSFDTINPPGNELACVQFLAAWLQEQGFVVELTGFGEQRANLIARLPGQMPANRWPLPAIWTPCRWVISRGSLILWSRHRWRPAVRARRQRYESGVAAFVLACAAQRRLPGARRGYC